VEFREILKRRKSVRAFEQQPVPIDVLDRILAVVRYAPSAGFTQGNEYLVLDTPEALADFWTLTDDPNDPLPAEMRLALPPVLILPLSNRQAYLDRYSEPDKAGFGLEQAENWPAPYWDIDAGMASMVILLAAIDEGLAAWFFGISSGEKALLERFGVSETFKPIGVIALGYAAAADPLTQTSSAVRRKRRPTEELMHRNGW
jgi:nitroreductase